MRARSPWPLSTPFASMCCAGLRSPQACPPILPCSTRPKNRPFCLTVAFFATHAEDSNPKQFLPQPQSMNLYRDVTVPVPPNATEASWKRLPYFFTEKNEGRIRWHWRFDTPKKYQTMMKNYYRLANEVDGTCGRILDELEQEGVLDSTLVIFTTDNGYYHAEHGLADKWYPHQESIRVPLIIRDPRMPKEKHGTTNDDFTLSVDLAPTILRAAGIPAPKTMQGQDIVPLYLAAAPPPWRSEFFYEHPCISNARWLCENVLSLNCQFSHRVVLLDFVTPARDRCLVGYGATSK